MVNHKLLGFSGTLVLAGGVLVTIIVLFLHPEGGATEAATFANFAASSDWFAIHLGQFVGTAAIMAGLLVLFFALDVSGGAMHWLGFFGAVSAVVAIALAGVLFAVDGVANKQAMDAWVSAPAAEQTARFASAEAIRWVEMGIASYHEFMMGLAFVLFAMVIVWTARVNRGIGILMGLSGLAYLVVGWFTGTKGFTPATNLPTDAAYLLLFASMIWLLIVAFRMKEAIQVAAS